LGAASVSCRARHVLRQHNETGSYSQDQVRTVSEIVEKTGFGWATVHRALKNDISVKFEVREKISYAIFDLNNQAIAKYKAEL